MAIRITIKPYGRIPIAIGTAMEARWFRRKLAAIAREMNVHAGTWSVRLFDDRRMSELHQRTMNIPGTTDVLTFERRGRAATDGAGRPGAAGSPLALQTVVCVDEARRQAKERGHPVRHELLLYMVHSLLHVTGYDDSAPAAARRMHRKEDDILRRLGVGPVFYRRRRKRGRPHCGAVVPAHEIGSRRPYGIENSPERAASPLVSDERRS